MPVPERRDLARYRVRRDGRTVWTGERPFALTRAVITDLGTVAGFANSHNLEIVALDASGNERVRRSITKIPPRYPDGPYLPYGLDIFVAAEPERLIMRVLDDPDHERDNVFWSHRMDGFGNPERFFLDPPPEIRSQAGKLAIVRAVPGTPLLLAHWVTSRWISPRAWESGAFFALFDADTRIVWSLLLHDDYHKASEFNRDWALEREMRKGGALLPGNVKEEFTVRFVESKVAVTFRVERNGEGWEVKELRRRPYPTGKAQSLSKGVNRPHL